MIESGAILLELGILLFSNVLFPNLLPDLSFLDAGIQYGCFEKKSLFITNRYFNIEKVSESNRDTVHGWIKSFYFQNVH